MFNIATFIFNVVVFLYRCKIFFFVIFLCKISIVVKKLVFTFIFTTFFIVGLAGTFTNQMRLFDFYGNTAELYLQTMGYYMYAGLQKAGADLTKYPFYAAMGLFFTCVSVPVVLILRWAMQKFGPRVD